METVISIRSAEVKSAAEVSAIGVRVNDTGPNAERICGKLEFDHISGDATFYREVAAGCIWVYLTDCTGVIRAGQQHMCQPGNTMRVEGCHAFGCSC
jgi:hypothetical protein